MRLLLGSTALVLVSVVLACSTAEEQATAEEEAVAAPDRVTDESPTEPAAAPDDVPPAPAPAPVTDGGSIDGAGQDGGALGGDGGTECVAGSVAETEGNDTAATANGIPSASGTFCGTLSSATDVDFLSFVLPNDAKGLGFGVSYTRQGLVVTGRVAGESFAIGGTPAFRPGQTYVLEVRATTGNAPISYRVSVDIQK